MKSWSRVLLRYFDKEFLVTVSTHAVNTQVWGFTMNGSVTPLRLVSVLSENCC